MAKKGIIIVNIIRKNRRTNYIKGTSITEPLSNRQDSIIVP